MSLFSGGTRNVSVEAAQDGYLAVFSFAQLERLHRTNKVLADKLSRQLALAALEKQTQTDGRNFYSLSGSEIERGVNQLLAKRAELKWDTHSGGLAKAESLITRKSGRASSSRPSSSRTRPTPDSSARASIAAEASGGGGLGRLKGSPSRSSRSQGGRLSQAPYEAWGMEDVGSPLGIGESYCSLPGSLTVNEIADHLKNLQQQQQSASGGGSTDAFGMPTASIGSEVSSSGDSASGWASRLSDRLLSSLAPAVAGVHFTAGEVLFRGGEPPMCCGILVSGATAEARSSSSDGSSSSSRSSDKAPPTELSIRGVGEFVGEEALFSHAPHRKQDIVGVEEGILLVLAFADLEEIHHRTPMLHTRLLHALAASVADSTTTTSSTHPPSSTLSSLSLGSDTSLSSGVSSLGASHLLAKFPSMNWSERCANTPPEGFIREMRTKAMTSANLALSGAINSSEEDGSDGGSLTAERFAAAGGSQNMLTSHVQPAEAARLLWSQCSWMRNAMSLGEVCGLSRALAVVRLSPARLFLLKARLRHLLLLYWMGMWRCAQGRAVSLLIPSRSAYYRLAPQSVTLPSSKEVIGRETPSLLQSPTSPSSRLRSSLS